MLIGVGGFKGPPSRSEVELGYSIVEEYRRRGFATEAVRGMLRFAFDQADVQDVSAQTLPELSASIAVLERTGFRCAGPGPEEGGVRYVISRQSWLESKGATGP
jgi:ribosomal-protein-alanine N-acetyltransferase